MWKIIPNYSRYEINSKGQIRRITDKRLLKPTLSGYGSKYYVVYIKNDKLFSYKTTYVHHLMAMTFLSKPSSKYIINHINGNTKDNRKCNLEYISCSENTKHAYDNNLIRCRKKIKKIICNETRQEFSSINELAEYLKIKPSTIRKTLEKNAVHRGLTYKKIYIK